MVPSLLSLEGFRVLVSQPAVCSGEELSPPCSWVWHEQLFKIRFSVFGGADITVLLWCLPADGAGNWDYFGIGGGTGVGFLQMKDLWVLQGWLCTIAKSLLELELVLNPQSLYSLQSSSSCLC